MLEVTLGDSLSVVSILVAILLGGLGLRYAKRRAVEAQTIAQISLLSSSGPLSEANYYVASRVIANDPIPPDIEGEEGKHVMLVLNFYEHVCTCVAGGLLDMSVVKHLRGAAIKKAFEISVPYIQYRRERHHRSLYKHLEDFAVTQAADERE